MNTIILTFNNIFEQFYSILKPGKAKWIELAKLKFSNWIFFYKTTDFISTLYKFPFDSDVTFR